MSKKRFASVWDAIGDTPAEATSMKLRATLANEIIERIRDRKLTQAKAAELIGVTQPRISDLMRGRLECIFSRHTGRYRGSRRPPHANGGHFEASRLTEEPGNTG